MKLKWFAASAAALSIALSSHALPLHAEGTANNNAAAYGQEGAWDAPPSDFREAQLHGFHDGVEGARKDFDNHRAPDVNNRHEYRHPPVSRSLRQDYRDGFERGYDRAMAHLMGDRYHSHY